MGDILRPIFEDLYILIVDKPSGVPSQPTRHQQPNVYDEACARFPYVGLHHRLDTPASGLLMMTLHRDANAPIATAFRNHEIHRSYQAVLLGDPGTKGEWEGAIDGRPAKTHWNRIAAAGGLSLVELTLATGRKHQIRRHAQQAGHPIIGDRRYGGAAGGNWPRLALHAARLAFTHPISGHPVQYESPIPEDLLALVDRVKVHE